MMKSSLKGLGLFLLLSNFVPGTLCQLGNGIGELSTNILKTSLKEGENTIHSAYSLSVVLGMCLAGARGETADVIQKALGISGLSENEISDEFKHITSQLAEIQHDDYFIVHDANRLYLNQSSPISENFKNRVIDTFKTEPLSVDFKTDAEKIRNDINDFVKNVTKGMIPSILDDPLSNLTILAAVNAIHLEGTWKHKLTNRTSDEKFNKLQCPDKSSLPGQTADWITVNSRFDFFYSSELQSTLVALPYESKSNSSRASMIIVLPDQPHRCNFSGYLETRFSWKNFVKAVESMSLEMVHFTMPKVKLDSKFDMTKILENLGLRQIFSQAANFTGMLDKDHQNDKIRISEFVHKAKMSIDENGTTASAASAVDLESASFPSNSTRTYRIFLNRSFLSFVVIKQKDKSILPLFSAVVNKI